MAINNKNFNVVYSAFLLLVSILVLFFSLKLQYDNKKDQDTFTSTVKDELNKAIEENLSKASDFPDFGSQSRLKKVELVKNFESWTPSSQLRLEKIKRLLIVEKGTLSKGYLYIRASLDNKALTQWESIYVTMNDRGGHLFRPQSLPVPSSQKTELLYALNDIPYLLDVPYNERATPVRTNWFNQYREGSQIEVLAFISSLRSALIEELTLRYECAKDSDCLLSIK